MDPDTALAELLAETVMLRGAIDLQDRAQIINELLTIEAQARDLAAWLDGGGHLPAATP